MIPKPKHLGPQYGDQFKDQSVASAYRHRPPYSPDVFDVLESFVRGKPRIILDLGCGPGSIAIPMARRVDRVDAVDPSEAMLRAAQTQPGWRHENIPWVVASAEEFHYPERYGLIFAAGSLHWMDWYVVFPKIRQSLLDEAVLATVYNTQGASPDPWSDSLRQIIPRYSTNQYFLPYDLFDELETRSLFQTIGRHESAPMTFSVQVEDYVEMSHSQNGFSRERMTPESAAAFDSEVTAAVTPFASAVELSWECTTEATWGYPLDGRT